ncbi:MAG: tyrosine-type recombinase/integrase [Porticoccaceae bacterium]
MAKERLNFNAVDKAKPGPTDRKFADGGGLYLLIKPNGSKYWRYDYRFNGKRKTLALGVYPDVGLKDARTKHADARAQVAQNLDPSEARRQARQEEPGHAGTTFAQVAREWWHQQKGTWTEDHADRIWRRFDQDVLPHLGERVITDISPQDIIRVVRQIEARNALDVASRVLTDIKRVFSYAVIMGYAGGNPGSDLNKVLKTRKSEHRASLPRAELPGFLAELESYSQQGRRLTQLALKLLILTFQRSAEIRGARWDEFDLKKRLWRIPGVRVDSEGNTHQGMKMKTEHLVPLSRQAIAVIKEINAISGQYELLFPSERDRRQPMSDNTLRLAIFRMGYDGNTPGKSKAVPHGFRNTASSLLNEQGFNADAIERQLSHMESNGVRAAYIHHARFMEERQEMMQWWADYLSGLKSSEYDNAP